MSSTRFKHEKSTLYFYPARHLLRRVIAGNCFRPYIVKLFLEGCYSSALSDVVPLRAETHYTTKCALNDNEYTLAAQVGIC